MTGRSRSRTRARSQSHGGGSGGASGLAALATAGLGALGAKKVLDRSPSQSRGRDYDSRSPSPDRRRQRSRSRSIVDKARNSLAKLSVGGDGGHRRRDQDDFDDRGSSHRPAATRTAYTTRIADTAEAEETTSRIARTAAGTRTAGAPATTPSPISATRTRMRRAKKMRGKQILTTGLATVATIHAAHGVYQSMDKRRARQRAVDEGRLSPAEAKRLKTKAMMQDATSVGIATLGIKSAIDEMKEVKAVSHECSEFRHEKARHHARRERRRQQRCALSPDGGTRAGSLPARRPPRSYHACMSDDYGPRSYDGDSHSTGSLQRRPWAVVDERRWPLGGCLDPASAVAPKVRRRKLCMTSTAKKLLLGGGVADSCCAAWRSSCWADLGCMEQPSAAQRCGLFFRETISLSSPPLSGCTLFLPALETTRAPPTRRIRQPSCGAIPHQPQDR